MSRMERLFGAIKNLINGEFSGYIKINFSQGSLGRVEKGEEWEEVQIVSGNLNIRDERLKDENRGNGFRKNMV